MTRSYAVIPTANRPDTCLQAVESIRSQVDYVYVIDNGKQARFKVPDYDPDNLLVAFLEWDGLPNLSRFWNLGLNMITSWTRQPPPDPQWNVAIINDDAVVPPGWVEAVSTRMRHHGAAAACSGSPTGRELLHMHARPVDLHTRMQGWAFVLAGEKGLRFDEDLAWWFADDDMDWRSRQAGGMLMIPGYPVVNQFPNGQMTPELQEQANRDRSAFVQKWGRSPW